MVLPYFTPKIVNCKFVICYCFNTQTLLVNFQRICLGGLGWSQSHYKATHAMLRFFLETLANFDCNCLQARGMLC